MAEADKFLGIGISGLGDDSLGPVVRTRMLDKNDGKAPYEGTFCACTGTVVSTTPGKLLTGGVNYKACKIPVGTALKGVAVNVKYYGDPGEEMSGPLIGITHGDSCYSRIAACFQFNWRCGSVATCVELACLRKLEGIDLSFADKEVYVGEAYIAPDTINLATEENDYVVITTAADVTADYEVEVVAFLDPIARREGSIV